MRLNITTTFGILLLFAGPAATVRSADPAPFTLTPPACSGLCGASRLTMQASRPAAPILLEHQDIEVRIQANDLLKSSGEHLAVSLMASTHPFLANGSWNAPGAPGGGLGVALGAISSDFHPVCPADPNDANVEFALERFAGSSSNGAGSTLVACASFSKALLASSPVLKLSMGVTCSPSSQCTLSATLRSASNNLIITKLTANVSRANTTSARKIWYAVTDFSQADPKRYSASFEAVAETYFAELKQGPIP